MFLISAEVFGGGMDADIVGCFDPTIVIVRMRKVFPEVEVIPQDYAWRDFDAFQQRGAVKAAGVAESDARRRGPIWAFRLPVPDGPPLRGRAERYQVSIWSEQPIPEPLRPRFIAFLEELRFAPFVSVKSVRLEGNDEFPA